MEQTLKNIENLFTENEPSFLKIFKKKKIINNLKEIIENYVFISCQKLKDPKAPKKTKTAFSFFYKKMFNIYKSENPSLPMIQITKMIGNEWKKLNEGDKKEFIENSDQDKKRFENEMKNYIRPSDDILKLLPENKPKKKRTKKIKLNIKKPKTAYILFSMEFRKILKDKFPEKPSKEISKMIGALWKNEYSSEEQRKKWIILSEKGKNESKENKEFEKESDKESDKKIFKKEIDVKREVEKYMSEKNINQNLKKIIMKNTKNKFEEWKKSNKIDKKFLDKKIRELSQSDSEDDENLLTE